MMPQLATTPDQGISLASNSKPSALLGYISEADFAAELAVSLRTVRRWDALRVGPARTRVGRIKSSIRGSQSTSGCAIGR